MSACRQGKQLRVDAVIAELGLEKCRNTLIGSPQRRGVSGGERKRVSVGHELVIDPSVLLLDEPTSGLDSTTAMHLLNAIRGLASGGRTIVTSIHQPSSRLFQQLDLVLLLADGHVIYSGLRSAVTDWFGIMGLTLLCEVNVADFILDIASGEFEPSAPGLAIEGSVRKAKLIEVCTMHSWSACLC
jgi:ABC-type multidrug transport system ATPase subunit